MHKGSNSCAVCPRSICPVCDPLHALKPHWSYQMTNIRATIKHLLRENKVAHLIRSDSELEVEMEMRLR